ncbi:MAG: AAA family ATPase [Pseudomonas sp.]|nr:AAA family ATPase [Pseudomonas sp.]
MNIASTVLAMPSDAASQEKVAVGFLDHCRADVSEVKQLTVNELNELLKEPSIGCKDGPAIVPANMPKGPRKAERVQSVSLLALDIEAKAVAVKDDHGNGKKDENGDIIKQVIGTEPPSPGEMQAELQLQGFDSILHTTYSHTTEHPRYRIILFLSRPLKPSELKPLGSYVIRLLGLADCADAACLDPSRLFYMPRCPNEERKLQYCHARVEGERLDADAMLLEAGREQAAQETLQTQRRAPVNGSVIDAFNAQEGVGPILEGYGYTPQRGGRWLWEGSTTGAAGVRLLPDEGKGERVYSSHGGDPLNDGHAHDAFDCFRILEHGGNTAAAMKDARRLLGMVAADTASLTPVDLSDVMSTQLDPVQYAVNPWMPRRHVTLFGGHGGIGKSSLALAISAHVACGLPFAGFEVQRCPVLFVSLEDEPTIVRYRLRKIIDAYSLPADSVLANMRLLDGTQGFAALMTEGAGFNTEPEFTKAFRELEDHATGAGLIIIDNASDAFDAYENSRRSVRAFIRSLAIMARTNDAAVVLLAHIDKASAKNGAQGNSYSGSTAWHNSARSRLSLLEADGRIQLAHEKANMSKKAEPLSITFRDSVPMPESTAWSDTGLTNEEYDQCEIMRALEAAAQAGINVPASVTPGAYSAMKALESLPEYMDTFRGKAGSARAARAITALARSGRIERIEYRKPNRHPAERWEIVPRPASQA